MAYYSTFCVQFLIGMECKYYSPLVIYVCTHFAVQVCTGAFMFKKCLVIATYKCQSVDIWHGGACKKISSLIVTSVL